MLIHTTHHFKLILPCSHTHARLLYTFHITIFYVCCNFFSVYPRDMIRDRMKLLLHYSNTESRRFALRQRLNFIHPCHNARAEASGPCIRWHFVTRVSRNYGNGGRHNSVAIRWQNPLAGKDEYLIWESASCECGRYVRATKDAVRLVTATNIVARWRSQNYRRQDAQFPFLFLGWTGKRNFSFSSERPPFSADERDKDCQWRVSVLCPWKLKIY